MYIYMACEYFFFNQLKLRKHKKRKRGINSLLLLYDRCAQNLKYVNRKQEAKVQMIT